MNRIRRPAVLIPIALVAVIAIGFGMWWFTPWRLVTDKSVDEALPAASPEAAGTVTSTVPAQSVEEPAEQPVQEPEGPTVLADGAFISHEHTTTGSAMIVELPDGRRFLRFENLDTSNGPELVAALSDGPVIEGTDGWRVFDDGRLVVLGDLKGNIGSQNYEIPADVDLNGLTAAVVWCDRFDVSFGAAELVPAP